MSRVETIGWFVIAMVTSVALAILWVFGLTRPPGQAATGAVIISAASGLSVAALTLAAGLLTAFRTQGIAGRVALLNERRQAYAVLLGAIDGYITARNAWCIAYDEHTTATRNVDHLGAQADDLGKEQARDSTPRSDDTAANHARRSAELAKELEEANAALDEAQRALSVSDQRRGEAYPQVWATLKPAILISSRAGASRLEAYTRSAVSDSGNSDSERENLYRTLRKELKLPYSDL